MEVQHLLMSQETRTKPHGVESARTCNAPWNKAGQMPKQIETQKWKSFWSTSGADMVPNRIKFCAK
ncbi:hypothetical protein USDA257_c48020 [Sinorhizobium fredii USDA 257]|uniref:Uncharacterized protein n=1 Tax=Sinorhizobium fredii (strain USDA 257) TaxID=1185652 RepID=I3XBT1_SINF2|nr:hypothetical protein USDA257_c48020 [Sinorhizobium fredii USDA 257]